MTKISKNPFTSPFLKDFILTESLLPFSSQEIIQLDKELGEYEQLFMNPEVEKNLISKNILLSSFAISKAENSALNFNEAKEVYDIILNNQEYGFVAQKIKADKKLTKKDYEHLEFFNIAKTFRELNARPFTLKDLTPDFIKNLHGQLTKGLDIFQNYLTNFETYRSGEWRNNDLVRVGNYQPAPAEIVAQGVEELIAWLNKNFSSTGIAVFHTALYALHPFNNGNKRVCRILEHILWRALRLNAKNLYSNSYYYHTEKERYYKYLLYSLERKNLNHFTAFVLEATALSIISVLKTSWETKKDNYLNNFEIDNKIKLILKPLVKRGEIQFKTLFKILNKKVARQTFVTYLEKAHKVDLIERRVAGRAVYYKLNLTTPEEKILKEWITSAKKKLEYIPDEIKLAV